MGTNVFPFFLLCYKPNDIKLNLSAIKYFFFAGQENNAREEIRPLGGQRAGKQLRQDRRRGNAASSSALHTIFARSSAKDVGRGSDAGRRRPC